MMMEPASDTESMGSMAKPLAVGVRTTDSPEIAGRATPRLQLTTIVARGRGSPATVQDGWTVTLTANAAVDAGAGVAESVRVVSATNIAADARAVILRCSYIEGVYRLSLRKPALTDLR